MSNDPKKSPDTPAQERPDPEVLPGPRAESSPPKTSSHTSTPSPPSRARAKSALTCVKTASITPSSLTGDALMTRAASTPSSPGLVAENTSLRTKSRGVSRQTNSPNSRRRTPNSSASSRRLRPSSRSKKNWRRWWPRSRPPRTRGRTREPSPSHPPGPHLDRLRCTRPLQGHLLSRGRAKGSCRASPRRKAPSGALG